MNVCPECKSSECKIVLTKQRSTYRYRRYECQYCLTRWSRQESNSIVRSMYDQRRLTDRQAAMIILSDQTERTLAKHYGLSRQAINHIRSGKSYANVYQQLLPLLNKETDL